MILAGKVICLFIGLAYGAAWFGKLIRGQPIGDLQTFLMVGGGVGFVTLQWLI